MSGLNVVNFYKALTDGKTIIDSKGQHYTLDTVSNLGMVFNYDEVYTIEVPPVKSVTLTKDQILHIWSEHVLGSGNGKPLHDDKCINFLRAAGFEV